MVTNRKVYGKAMSMPAGIGIGTTISLIVMVCGCAVLAVMLEREVMEIGGMGYGVMTVLLVSSFLGAATAAGLVKHRRLVVCMIQAVCYFCLLLLINGLMFGGAVSGVWVTGLLLLGGAGSAGLIGLTGEKRGIKKNIKWRTG